MAIDFHPTHTSLLAVGMYDGTVAVYDMRHKSTKPIFASSVRTGKHNDPVWQVCPELPGPYRLHGSVSQSLAREYGRLMRCSPRASSASTMLCRSAVWLQRPGAPAVAAPTWVPICSRALANQHTNEGENERTNEQVAWQSEDMAKTLSFASVSSDGRVTMWNMSKSELQHQARFSAQ